MYIMKDIFIARSSIAWCLFAQQREVSSCFIFARNFATLRRLPNVRRQLQDYFKWNKSHSFSRFENCLCHFLASEMVPTDANVQYLYTYTQLLQSLGAKLQLGSKLEWCNETKLRFYSATTPVQFIHFKTQTTFILLLDFAGVGRGLSFPRRQSN